MKKKIISCFVIMIMLFLLLMTAVKSVDDSDDRASAFSAADFVEEEGNPALAAAESGEGGGEDQVDKGGEGDQADTDGKEEEGEKPLEEELDESDEEESIKAIPAVPDLECFTYEELADGTLRLTGYDESKNTQNPYQVILPSSIDGKRVSTLGTGCLAGSDKYSGHLLELTIPEGITSLEANVIEHAYDIGLVTVPDSVSWMDEKAFWRNDYQQNLVIACHDTSYAYQYAKENDFSCRVLEPALPENAFLSEYAEGPETGLPYFGHYWTEGTQYDYISMEYRDNQIERRLGGEMVYHYPNEFLVLVLDKDSGDVRQCIDSSFIDPDYVAFYWIDGVTCKSFLSIADWNFDGMEDLRCWQGVFGTGAASFSELFLYDKVSGLYVYEREFSGIDSPSLRKDKQCIYGFSRGGAVYHYVDRYEYVDGVLTHVACLSMEGTLSEDRVEGMEITDERLIDGEWQVYRHEIFWAQDMSAEDPLQDAGEQSKVLYVNDGYWDLW